MVLTAAPVSTQPPGPGGTGGPCRVTRGFRIAAGSIRTLFRNRPLFWYSFLTGLLFLFIFLAELSLIVLSGSYSYWVLGYRTGLLLTFGIYLTGFFCMNVLLAGLFLTLSLVDGWPISVRDGLARATKHLQPLLTWSLIAALAGTAVHTVALHHPLYNVAFPAFVTATLSVPFTYYLPHSFLSALALTLIRLFIIIVLFIPSLFVVPVLVLEKKEIPAPFRDRFRS